MSDQSEVCMSLKVGGLYRSTVIGHLFLSSATLGLNSLLLVAIIRTKVLPSNVRLLLGNMTFALLLTEVVSVAHNANYIEILVKGFLVPMHRVLCATTACSSVVLAVLLVASMVSLAYERWLATKKLHQKKQQKGLKIRILVGSVWVLALTSAIITVANRNMLVGESDSVAVLNSSSYDQSNGSMWLWNCSICPEELLESRTSVLVVTIPSLVLEILLISVYVKIWRVNKSKLAKFDLNSTTHSLEERYEIRQNIRTTLMILPLVLAHGVCWLLVMASFSVHSVLVHNASPDQAATVHSLVRFPFQAYGVLHPVLIFSANKHLCRIAICLNTAGAAKQDHTTSHTAPASGHLQAGTSLAPKPNKAGVEFRVNPVAGLKIVESIWEKNKQQPGPSKPKDETGEPMVEIDQLWEEGRPKWHRRPHRTTTEEKTGWTSFVSMFHGDSDSVELRRGQKYMVSQNLTPVE